MSHGLRGLAGREAQDTARRLVIAAALCAAVLCGVVDRDALAAHGRERDVEDEAGGAGISFRLAHVCNGKLWQRLVIFDGQHGCVGRAERRTIRRITQGEVDGFIRPFYGIVYDGNCERLIRRIEVAPSERAGNCGVVRACCGCPACDSSVVEGVCAETSTRALDGDGGLPAVLIDAVSSRAKLQAARPVGCNLLDM